MKIKVPAKLNLSLYVAGRRPDGYHTLDSVAVSVAVYDEIEVTNGDGRLRKNSEAANSDCAKSG